MKMNKPRLALAAALLSAAALASTVAGDARAESLGRLFPVDFGTRVAWNGKTRITGRSATIVDTLQTTCGLSSMA